MPLTQRKCHLHRGQVESLQELRNCDTSRRWESVAFHRGFGARIAYVVSATRSRRCKAPPFIEATALMASHRGRLRSRHLQSGRPSSRQPQRVRRSPRREAGRGLAKHHPWLRHASAVDRWPWPAVSRRCRAPPFIEVWHLWPGGCPGCTRRGAWKRRPSSRQAVAVRKIAATLSAHSSLRWRGPRCRGLTGRSSRHWRGSYRTRCGPGDRNADSYRTS